MQKIKNNTLKVINYEEKEMILLSEDKNESYKEQDACHICKKSFI